MSIHMRGLKPDTYRALEELYNEREWAPIFAWMEPEQVAWLTYCLEFVPDATFPRGKWATIQHLQDLTRDAAKQSVAAAVPAPPQP